MKRHTLFLLLILLLMTSELLGKPVVEAKMIGQLGNQMFQIATAYSLALDNGAKVIAPGLKKNNFKNTDLNKKYVFSKVSTSKPKRKIKHKWHEPHFHYKKIPFKGSMYIKGFFQSEKYFKHRREEILELFKPLPETVEKLTKRFGHVIRHPNSVAVHVRTYLPDCPNGSDFFVFQGWEYYENMIKTFPEDYLFIVCSDRIDLCKENLSHIDRDVIFIEENKHYEDMYLMSMCKHNIISNSSFSWWSAWLNNNPEKIVIAPPVWFGCSKGHDTKDVIPDEWIVYKN